ncbi:PAAR domain-containing protein [Burkholderia sp. Ac-20349]|uniref:PAAR domain-containing protein n=1 Tax=Burkholderia sp. Ac-20349 TaxID=2703893 RepID=UPI00197B6236|nr:PAAR domain-containing protein [Burkholderia sp. Ac-20349]MBN3839269.1 PAAR domain-containing protein [Burkholderia sp. Ac-20349]
MGNAIARLGDSSDHGGTITSASGDVLVNGIGAARAGDTHVCPISGHGTTTLSSTSTVMVNGRAVVRIGDTAGCGAKITRGSPSVSAG